MDNSLTSDLLPQLPPPPPPPPYRPQKKIASIQKMVRDAYKQQASDIHIRVGELPRFRVRGQMEVYERGEVVTPKIFAAYLDEILSPSKKQRLAKNKELDTAIVYAGFLRCRVNCFQTLTGGAIVLRLITLHIPSIDNLGLPSTLKNIINKKQGLILVTGPTGSGKSTTIAAMIRYLNETAQKHIVTIEDPIEYVHTSQNCLISQREVGLHTHDSQNCLISQREVGLHTHDFHEALRSVLREDPDVILIGEMRDRITVDTAIKAAQTGHLVLGTLHSKDSIRTINRLLNLYNPDEQAIMRVQIVDSLVAVINQHLLTTTDGGRTAAMEILINTPTMQDYLLKGEEAEAYELMEASSKEGMKVMNDALCELMLTGQISIEDAFTITPDMGDLRRRSRNEGLDPSHTTRRDVYTAYSYSSR